MRTNFQEGRVAPICMINESRNFGKDLTDLIDSRKADKPDS